VGSCVIDANQAGNSSYADAPQASQTIPVGLVAQTIVFTSSAPDEAMVDGTYVPVATGGGSENPVIFSIAPSSSAICTYSAGTVTFIAVGTCLVDANQVGDGSTYGDAEQVDQTIAVGVIAQAIAFTTTAPTDATVIGTYTPTATGGASGNLVTFSIDPGSASVCSVSSGVVTFNAVGTCKIDADQQGNSTYGDAPQVSQTIAVGVIPQAILFTTIAPNAAIVTGTYTPSASGGGSGNPVTFSIDPGSASVCTYSDGSVNFNAAGSCVIDARQEGNSTYGDAPQVSQTVAVSLVAQTIVISSSIPVGATVGGTYTPVATGGSSEIPVTFSIDPTSTSVCSISSGVVTFAAAGTCLIDADEVGNGTYASAPQVDQTVAVVLVAQEITFTTTAPTEVAVNATYTPMASGGGSGIQVTISIDPGSMSVCSLNSGTVTFIAVGTCLIEAHELGNTTYAAAEQSSQTIAVGVNPQAITFTTTTPVGATVNGTYSPMATGGGSGNPVTFSVDDSSSAVCTYNEGVITFIAVGTCRIDANQEGNGTSADAPEVDQTVVVRTVPARGTAPTGTAAPYPPAPPVLELSVAGPSASIVPGSSYELTLMPALARSGGPATTAVSFSLQLPTGETISVLPTATAWSCRLSVDSQVLSCTWTGVLPVLAGTAMDEVEVEVDVATSAIGPLAATIEVSDPSDGATQIAVKTTSDASWTVAGAQAGYRLVGSDGGVFNFGGARFASSCKSAGQGCRHLSGQIVSMAGAPDGHGYWLVGNDGGIFAFGSARYFGSCPASSKPCGTLSSPVVAMAATPDGLGYWLVAANGTVFAFGDAGAFGSCLSAGQPCGHLGAPIVAMAAQPDGLGYWLAGADGAVYAFGQARFHGSTRSAGVLRLRARVVGMATTVDGNGYWLAASDGGVFAFGDAKFLGNTYTAGVEDQLQGPIVGIAPDPNTVGYWLASRDGGVFAFGTGGFLGDTYSAKVEEHLDGPVVGIAPGG
jgi:hypothetical protein